MVLSNLYNWSRIWNFSNCLEWNWCINCGANHKKQYLLHNCVISITNIIIEFVSGKGVELLLETREIIATKRGGVGMQNHKLGMYVYIRTRPICWKFWKSMSFEMNSNCYLTYSYHVNTNNNNHIYFYIASLFCK